MFRLIYKTILVLGLVGFIGGVILECYGYRTYAQPFLWMFAIGYATVLIRIIIDPLIRKPSNGIRSN